MCEGAGSGGGAAAAQGAGGSCAGAGAAAGAEPGAEPGPAAGPRPGAATFQRAAFASADVLSWPVDALDCSKGNVGSCTESRQGLSVIRGCSLKDEPLPPDLFAPDARSWWQNG